MSANGREPVRAWPVRYYYRHCYDCGKSYRADQKAAHYRGHLDRPDDNCLTLDEARDALGTTKGSLNHAVRTGRLKVVRTEGRKRVWVTRQALAAYARAAQLDPEKLPFLKNAPTEPEAA